MSLPVGDLHSDLLVYLAMDRKRDARDEASRCSIPQLRKGNVKFQTLAIFAETTPDSLKMGMRQLDLYRELPRHYPADFIHYRKGMDPLQSSQITILSAYENASSFFPEGEPLQKGLDRLQAIIKEEKPLYISLTWNLENRFGGGSSTKIGLREDGKSLLDLLHGKKIAVDLSHTSDALAHDILNYLTSRNLDIPVIASHSNSRAIVDYSRNLPDEIAKEIFRRKGIIGLNLFRRFVGESEEGVLHHLAHWIELGGQNQICLGSDFFCETDVPLISLTHTLGGKPFFDKFDNAGCYPALLQFIEKELRVSVEDLASGNLQNFIDEH